MATLVESAKRAKSTQRQHQRSTPEMLDLANAIACGEITTSQAVKAYGSSRSALYFGLGVALVNGLRSKAIVKLNTLEETK